jgi:hypothetical protein
MALFNLLVASRMLPESIVTFLSSAHSEMAAALLSFCTLDMLFTAVLKKVGPTLGNPCQDGSSTGLRIPVNY